MADRSVAHVGVLTIEGPADAAFAFLGRSGWVGARCSCGFLASGRSLGSLEEAMADHQAIGICPAWTEFKAQEAEIDT